MSKNGNYRLGGPFGRFLAAVLLMIVADVAMAGKAVPRVTTCSFANNVASCDGLDKSSYPNPYLKILAANAELDQYYCIQPAYRPDGSYIGEHGQYIGSCNYTCPPGSVATWGYPTNDSTSDLTLFCYDNTTPGDTQTGGGTSGGKDGSSSGTNTSGTSGGNTSGSTSGGGESSGSSGTTTSGQTGGANSSGSTTSGQSGGTSSGSTTSGGSTSGGGTSGGNTSGSTSGGQTGGQTSGSGQTSGGYTSGAQTSGGDTSGTTTSGSNTSGGTTSGTTSGSTTSSGTTAGTTTSSGGNQNGGNGGTPGTDDFCTQHPTLTICKNSQVTGACAETQCDGDAIQCAILRTQQKRDCEDHDDKQPQYVLGKNILDGTDPMKNVLPSVDKASEIDVARDIRADGFGGGASTCATDKDITLFGQSFVMPLSKVCDYLLPLRFAIMVIASIVSFKMLSGVILRD